MPLVSIALTTYNGEKYLREQLDSIFRQTVRDFELLICDDCSSDGTWQIVQEYVQRFPAIKAVRNPRNVGFKQNFANAVSLCSGDYVAFADQDDVWTEQHLELLLSIIGGKDLACADAELVDEQLRPLHVRMHEVCHISAPFADTRSLQYFLFCGHNFVQGTAMLVRRSFLLQHVPIPDLAEFHDYWFALNAALGQGIAYSFEPVLLYRQHGGNVTEMNTTSLLRRTVTALRLKKEHRENRQRQIALLEQLQASLPAADSAPVLQDCLSFLTAWQARRFPYYVWFFFTHYKLMHGTDSWAGLLPEFVYLLFF